MLLEVSTISRYFWEASFLINHHQVSTVLFLDKRSIRMAESMTNTSFKSASRQFRIVYKIKRLFMMK